MENDADGLCRLVIEVANGRAGNDWAELKRLLPRARLFVKVTGAGKEAQHGERLVADSRQPLQMRMVRLQNGLKMVFAAVIPPRQVAAGETIATLAGAELCTMLIRTDADGLFVSAEDPGRSWVALKREDILVMLDAVQAEP